MNFEDFHPNIRRKVEADHYDLDKEVRFKPKTKLRAAKLELMRKDLFERQDRDGNQATLEYILDLAWYAYNELEHKPQKTLNQISATRRQE